MQYLGRPIGDVDNAAPNGRTTVVDGQYHGPAIAQVGNSDPAAEGQAAVGRRKVIHVIDSAARRSPPVVRTAVPGREADLSIPPMRRTSGRGSPRDVVRGRRGPPCGLAGRRACDLRTPHQAEHEHADQYQDWPGQVCHPSHFAVHCIRSICSGGGEFLTAGVVRFRRRSAPFPRDRPNCGDRVFTVRKNFGNFAAAAAGRGEARPARVGDTLREYKFEDG